MGDAGADTRGEAARPTAAAAATSQGGPAAAKAPKPAAPELDARPSDRPERFDPVQAAESRASSPAAQAAGPAAHPVRGAPETVASLAAEIIKKLDARSTRFDVELDPLGLGKVDVRVEIGANGRMTAALSFENPQAAADLKARSGELQKALEQAGFDLSGGLSFDTPGDRGQARQDWQDGRDGFRGRAFQQALETANEADLAAGSGELRLRRGVSAGVDVRI
ncbi:flagellar hook-length control protein FliK [Phenylobacterium sp. J426]|uniref:flagellar hook-length control protein FliK n=1 Tax=Phenylobacterium sp. J426 TaxID=2898439 RepID=UPI0021515ED6|nr:flagellar hook-length control protein FliK [Phenylobacterium sp. J426]MCR5874745.1 flagellar hook-length control protein FliK [Phenylobacterium sp. J426]